jgi:hypothetical protein
MLLEYLHVYIYCTIRPQYSYIMSYTRMYYTYVSHVHTY